MQAQSMASGDNYLLQSNIPSRDSTNHWNDEYIQ